MSHTSGDADNHKADELFIPSSRWGEDILVDAKLVEHNLLGIKNKIAPCKPRIIGVTKYFGLNAVISGYEAGLRDFGESRAVEAIQKMGYITVESFQNTAANGGGKLFNDLCGFNKKNKLGLATAEVKAWIDAQKAE